MFKNGFIKLLLFMFLFLGLQTQAQSFFQTYMGEIDEAYYMQKSEILTVQLQDNLNSVVIDKSWHNYIKAIINLRLAMLNLDLGDEKQADLKLDSALMLIDNTIQVINKADYSALKSLLLGLKISIKPFPRGMKLGKSSDNALDFAMKNKANDMRVQFIAGKTLLNKPSLFGGNKVKAFKKLNKAFELSKNNKAPFWGQTDVIYWHAYALIKQGNPEDAIVLIHSLLIKYPNNEQFKRLLKLTS